MKQYYQKSDTPLAFHKFLWWVSLPLSILTVFINMFSLISGIEYFNWLYAVDIGYNIAAIILMLICFIGFFGWKQYAWYSLIGYLCLNVVYSLYSLILYSLYIPEQTATVLGQLIAFSIYAVCVSIYYIKRRPLFASNSIQDTPIHVINPENADKDDIPSIDTLQPIKLCRNCGFELLPSSVFCSKCGTSISENIDADVQPTAKALVVPTAPLYDTVASDCSKSEKNTASVKSDASYWVIIVLILLAATFLVVADKLFF